MKYFLETYGGVPKDLGYVNIVPSEMVFSMYLPVKLPNGNFNLPKNLLCYKPLLNKVRQYEKIHGIGHSIDNNYIYLTVKHIWVTPDNPGNRPGWHSDGYGTDDINYIWYDKFPTLFSIGEFRLPKDCGDSLKLMDRGARRYPMMTFPDGHLLRLTQDNIHRSPDIPYGTMRTFVKISISDDKYNLKGNAHNYNLNYDWDMYDREEVRNHPQKLNSDSI